MPLAFFKSSPPVKKVVLLPDHLFFVRVVPVEAAVEVTSQIELALESLSPFSVAQLFYGWFLPPGEDRALVFAAYRKRFTTEQTAAWTDADAVLPSFSALLDAGSGTAAALLLTTADGLTGLAWDGHGRVPARVVSRCLAAEATAEERAAVRAEILGALEVPDAAEVAGPIEVRGGEAAGEIVLAAGAQIARFGLDQLDALDVRDKAELRQRWRERRRNLMLWRVFAGCLAGLGLALLLELALIGGRVWQKSRTALVLAQTTAVQRIETSQQLASRIEELASKRLMPFEMISFVNEKRPHSIYFKRSSTDGLYKLLVDAQTNNAAEVDGYASAVRAAPYCEKAEVRDLRSRDGITQFTLIVTFKPEALLPKPVSS